MKESKNLEFKEVVTRTFLKTVSAFANYETGMIKFGINDGGEVIGVDNPIQVAQNIENMINDSLQPIPHYQLNIDDNSSVVILKVFEGIYKPYFYKSKAYKRSDTATIEVDRMELTRLILEGQNISYEELPAKKQSLEFSILEKYLKTVMHLKEVTQDTLKTLELYSDSEGFNIAGELLADENSFDGIDIIRFGKNLNIILDRETFEHTSIIEQYENSIRMYRKYFQFEQIKGSQRQVVTLIPEEAFREAIANAIVHRSWDIPTRITVSMFEHHIEIVSPGGLPNGLSKESYLNGGVSILKNRIIGSVFLRLQMIERFGTGIRRIMEAYQLSQKKPKFEIQSDFIKIILPVIDNNSLTGDRRLIYDVVKGNMLPSSMIIEETGFGKSKVVSLLNELVDEGYIIKKGNGRGSKYIAE